jgi:hypothetical protein
MDEDVLERICKHLKGIEGNLDWISLFIVIFTVHSCTK